MVRGGQEAVRKQFLGGFRSGIRSRLSPRWKTCQASAQHGLSPLYRQR